MHKRPIALLFLTFALTACGGGGTSSPGAGGPSSITPPATPSTDPGTGPGRPTTLAPVRLEIAPDTVLLTAPQQQKQLVARAFDSLGNVVVADIQWSSTRPEQVTVDAAGRLRATGGGGSAQITASIGSLRSAPLLAVHTQVPVGAVLLTDANIVGQPEESTPGAVASLTNTYRTRLVGIAAPKVGDLIINTEAKTVAGRVRAVATSGNEYLVTLALVSAREMFPTLNINEVIDLNAAEVIIPADILRMYDTRRDGNTFTFTPKPGQINLQPRTLSRQFIRSNGPIANGSPPSLSSEFSLGPFGCKAVADGAAGTGSEIMALTLPPVFTVALNPRLDVISTPANGLERFVLHAEPNVSLEVGVKALIAAELKVTCETEVLSIKIPIGGPLSLIVGGVLPVGVGAELGGKFTVVNLGISGKITAKTTGDLGLACPSAGCAVVADFGKPDVGFTPAIDLPTLNDTRLEPALSTYAFIKASIGNPLLKSLRFDAFKVKAGGAFKGNFSTMGIQIGDSTYQSDYKLVSEIKAGADTGFTGLAGLLGLNAVVETLLEISSDIGTTPVGTVVADKETFVVSDSVNFTVTLDPKKIDFIPLVGPYNVERIVLVRGRGGLPAQPVASIPARAGQTEFNFSIQAPSAGRADEFYAFVVTKLLPTDLVSLELGRAAAPSKTLANAIAVGTQHTCALSNLGGVKCWGRNQFGQLGNGLKSESPSTTPVDVSGLATGVIAIGAGESHSCALLASGAVACWGNGFLGNGSNESAIPVLVTGLSSGFKAISVGRLFTCALTTLGAVKCWGANEAAQLGNGNANSGTIGFSTPSISENFPVDVTGLAGGIAAISSGLNFSCALTNAGAVKCWGFGGFGTYGSGSVKRSYMPVDVTRLGGVLAVSAGAGHACALTTTGAVSCWGGNSAGQLGNGPSSARCDGPNVECSAVPVPVNSLTTGVLSISAGQAKSCAVLAGGAVSCWGADFDANTRNNLPTLKSGLTNPIAAVSVSTLGFHSCAINTSGAVQCWGDNQFGQLGNGATANSAQPVNVRGFP